MLKKTYIITAVAILGLAGCLESDAERAIVGAGVGVVAAEATGTDTTTGALGGAVAGALCDDVRIC